MTTLPIAETEFLAVEQRMIVKTCELITRGRGAGIRLEQAASGCVTITISHQTFNHYDVETLIAILTRVRDVLREQS